MTETLGEKLVYPGHPVPVALCIVRVFENYESAFYRDKDNELWALGALDVPGSEACVYLALGLLERLRGMEWETAMEWSDSAWGLVDNQAKGGPCRIDPDWAPMVKGEVRGPRAFYRYRHKKGLEQALRTAPLLREMEPWWKP